MNKWLKLLMGLILVIGAVLIWYFSAQWGDFWNFGKAAWEILKGVTMWMVILIGALLILLGISDLKE